MDLSTTDVLCIYGIGRGDLYPSFAQWLHGAPLQFPQTEAGRRGHSKDERYLIYLEDDEESFTSFFLSDQAKDPQVKAFFFREDNQEEVFKQIVWQMVFLRFSYLIHPEYSHAKAKSATEVIAKISYLQTAVHLLASDYSDLGIRVLRNIFANAPLFKSSLRGEKLRGTFKGIPAIICGAGPSLQKNLSQLPSLRDKALLFAGGAALNALGSLLPDFAAGIDPAPPLERFLAHGAFMVPFCYQGRYASELLHLVQGPLVWLPDSGTYPVENWVQGDLQTFFEGGWTVGTFCLALSHFFGCDPIILVGMDFATEGEQIYASGVSESSSLDPFLEVQDVDGKRLYSKRDWIMAAEWISSFAKQQTGSRIINATEGGLRLKDIPHLTLKGAAETYLLHSFDLKGKVHACLQLGKESPEPAREGLKEMEKSLRNCESLCDEMLGWFEKSHPASPETKGEFVICEFDLEDEVAFQKIFSPIWNVWKHLFERRCSVSGSSNFLSLNKLLFFKKLIDALKGVTYG